MIIIMIISLREREREREVAQKGQQQIALDSSVLLDSNLPQSHQLQHQKAAVIVGVRGGKNRRREKWRMGGEQKPNHGGTGPKHTIPRKTGEYEKDTRIYVLIW